MKDDSKDGFLEFDGFYDGFMAPHFGCYKCEDAKKALQCIDMDADGKVDWKEFQVSELSKTYFGIFWIYDLSEH